MSKPITMTMTHHVGQEEAVRRIKSGIEAVRTKPLPLAIEATEWRDNLLNFRLGALGVRCHGTLLVTEGSVRMDLHVPAVLAYVIDKYLTIVRAKAQVLLGSK